MLAPSQSIEKPPLLALLDDWVVYARSIGVDLSANEVKSRVLRVYCQTLEILAQEYGARSNPNSYKIKLPAALAWVPGLPGVATVYGKASAQFARFAGPSRRAERHAKLARRLADMAEQVRAYYGYSIELVEDLAEWSFKDPYMRRLMTEPPQVRPYVQAAIMRTLKDLAPPRPSRSFVYRPSRSLARRDSRPIMGYGRSPHPARLVPAA
ncbi:MAG: hypothetical protein HY053_08665 [Proteobacteria bacterium]|nr:hypothetical protein [Pseudomonadota bacterium]